ncbi:histidine kinase [Mycobacterium sp. AMU20-3851]|uniref:sensor histidine kinase n=1 Tax=Mycobacterium sp. AMU20-3851 TaxID=3122055 RepID=UPI003754B89A
MASRRLTLGAAAESVPRWRAPEILILALVRSSTGFGHDLINQFRAERFQVFLVGHFAMWFGAGVLLPAWEYVWMYRSPWFLVLAGVSVVHSAVIVYAIRLARRERYELSITLVCIGNWIGVLVVVYVSPPLLAVMVIAAFLPVTFAEPYVRWQRGLVFVGITGICLLCAGMLARFTPPNDAVLHSPRWVESAFVIAGLAIAGLNLMVIVWNNAAALRTSESHLAERAAELAASRARLSAAADRERRRIERDLHDGAQQHLVALSVLIQLARNGDGAQQHRLLDEAGELVDTAIAEIRRLAQGIYPPLLVSGGLPEALPTLAARSSIPVHLDLDGIGRYPRTTEAALYFCCSEALQNAAKHGGPGTAVTITGRSDGQGLKFVIADTGPGFDAATAGTGLTNMTDRLSAIGGTLTVETAPGRGTQIIATVDEPATSEA